MLEVAKVMDLATLLKSLHKGLPKEPSRELLDERDPQWMARATEVALKKLRTTPRLAEAFRKASTMKMPAWLTHASDNSYASKLNRSCRRS